MSQDLTFLKYTGVSSSGQNRSPYMIGNQPKQIDNEYGLFTGPKTWPNTSMRHCTCYWVVIKIGPINWPDSKYPLQVIGLIMRPWPSVFEAIIIPWWILFVWHFAIDIYKNWHCTVKLGYNDHRHNEKVSSIFLVPSDSFTAKYVHVYNVLTVTMNIFRRSVRAHFNQIDCNSEFVCCSNCELKIGFVLYSNYCLKFGNGQLVSGFWIVLTRAGFL